MLRIEYKCDAMGCDVMGCDMMGCDAMGWDAMGWVKSIQIGRNMQSIITDVM